MYEKKNFLFILIIVSFISLYLIFFLSCSNGNEKSDSNYEKNQTVKIGSILSLTGDAASYGDMMKKGMEIAKEEINSKGGIYGKNLEIIYEDSRFEPKEAISCYQRLKMKGVKFICGITGSKNALNVVQQAKKDKILVIDALSSSPMLSQYGGEYYFRVMPPDDEAGRYIAKYANEKGKKLGAIIYANDDWGNAITQNTIDEFEKLGGKILLKEGIEPKSIDVKNVVAKLKISKPNVVFLLAYAPESGRLIKSIKENKIPSMFIGSDNLSANEFPTIAGEGTMDILFVLPDKGKGDIYNLFKKNFLKKFQEDPSINSIKSYDTVFLLSYVLNAIKEYNTEKAGHFLRNIVNFEAASGIINFDQKGNIKNPQYVIMRYNEKGTYEKFGE